MGALNAGQAHEAGDVLAVPAMAAVADLSAQPPSAVDTAVLAPSIMGGVGAVGLLDLCRCRATGAGGPLVVFDGLILKTRQS
ncbi:hypothetical protein [Kineococcus sp. SYSU DK005]|uniref:hypothetical protein n=1 Tax=Kineococcus sp. SYSU DK005 TaxID=3383126 RepID=UPI003D7C5F1E